MAKLLKEFSWVILLIGMTVLPFLMGKGVLAVLYGRRDGELYKADCLLTGWLACIGLAEAAHLTAVFLGRPFSDAVRVFGAGAAAALLFSCGVLFWKRAKNRGTDPCDKRDRRGGIYGGYGAFTILLAMAFLLLALYQLVQITTANAVYRAGDMTAETVESFLQTDAFYQVNPLTGRAYTEGIPLRLKILCLPTLYGIFCRIFGISVMEMVWKVIPTAVLLGSYLAFYLLAAGLFPGRGGREKRLLFLVFTALVFLAGDYRYGMDGFGILYSGFRGVTIRNTILVPYTFSLILRRKGRSAVLCALAEACIVWTLYGLGACLAVMAGMGAIRLYRKRPKKLLRFGEGSGA